MIQIFMLNLQINNVMERTVLSVEKTVKKRKDR